MSIVGIDFGNEYGVVGVVGGGGVDIALNENSKRLNRTLASFSGKQRRLAEAAVDQIKSNYRNTVTQVKRLIGRKFKDPDVQYEIANYLHYNVVERADGGVGIEVNYDDKPRVFTPEAILAMILTRFTGIAAEAKGARAGAGADVVVSVPADFNDVQRLAVLDACRIGGVRPLRLLNESTAAAVAYGIYKNLKKEFTAEPRYVMFVDMGHSQFTASIAAFTDGKLEMKAAATDRHAGSREIDMALARTWAEEFKAKYGSDPWANAKARIKLMGAAQKAKHTLSPHGVDVARVVQEFLYQEKDFQTSIDITAFDKLCEPVLARMEAPIKQALAQAGIEGKQLNSVEIIGGGMRPRCVKRRVAELLGFKVEEGTNHGLSTTLNLDECIARGCALQCAILSPHFNVKAFEVVDRVQYPVRVSWNADAGSLEEGKEGATSAKVFSAGDKTPLSRRITFRQERVRVAAHYDVDLGASAPAELGAWELTVPADVPRPLPKMRVDFRHDLNGIISLAKADMMVEKPEPAAPAPDADAGEKPMEGVEGADSKKADAEGADTPAEGADTPADGADKPADGADAKKADAPKEEPKKKFSRVSIQSRFVGTPLCMTRDQLRTAMDEEAAMVAADRLIVETLAKRNELEAYIYKMRNLLRGELSAYEQAAKIDAFQSVLTEAEDWLYGDGFEVPKDVYQAKVDELRATGEPISRRQFEHENRSEAVATLNSTMEKYQAFANSVEEKYAHIEDNLRETVRKAVEDARKWMTEGLDKQGALALTDDPAILVADIRHRRKNLVDVCEPITRTPKPKPKAPTPPPVEPKESAEGKETPEESADAEAAPEAAAPAPEGEAPAEGKDEGDAPAAGSEPMEGVE